MRRAATVGLLMRNSVNLVVALVTLLDPDALAQPQGKWLLAALASWSIFRIFTRSQSHLLLAIDYVFVLAVCLAMPVLVPDPHFYSFNTAPQAIAGTAVVSISVVVSPYASLPMTLGIALVYAVGAAAVVGLENLSAVAALYYFAVQWTTASLIRVMLLRIAMAVDRARSDRHAAELNQRVTDAVRDYEREQLALLHDTAASTLLMVGHGTSLPSERLAAQARRDLELLGEGPWVAPPSRVELVAALRQCAAHSTTPVRFEGADEVWVVGDTAKSVIAAARETMNNVDRHAGASRLRVAVSSDRVVLEDDGVGFEPHAPRSGHGINDSIIGRMQRAGGRARISSTVGAGTLTELSWSAEPDVAHTREATDPDRLIERIRTRYGLALTVYALVNLAFAVPHAVITSGDVTADVVLGAVAALSTLAAVPGILYGRWRAAPPAAVALLVVSAMQPLLLPAELVGGYAHWAQGTIGWCVLPLLLGLSARTGCAVLVLYWLVGAAAEVIRHLSTSVLANIGLGSASILGVQLFALVFNGLMRDAAADVQRETATHQRLITRDRIAQALQSEYRRRYAKLVDNVVPLLEMLSQGGTVDESLQHRARAESRRLRVLFDQATTFDHPLMQRLRPLVDAAEERHIETVVDVAGALPDLTNDEIDSLAKPLIQILDGAESAARLVLTSNAHELVVSVVCDSTVAAELAETFRTDGDDVDVVTSADAVWCVIRHRLGKPPTGSALAGSDHTPRP
jgi:hypothetical protein